MHPARRKLAGRPEGALFDRLAEAQQRLLHGEDGSARRLSCSTAQLRRIAEMRPQGPDMLARLLDAPRMERFGTAFLAEINAAGE